jgi:hypothetical protein
MATKGCAVMQKKLKSGTRRLLNAVRFWVYGACVFWAPDCLWHALRKGSFSLVDLVILNGFLPMLVALPIVRVLIRSRNAARVAFASAMMIIGLLTTAPFWLTLNATFSPGGELAKETLWVLLRESPWTLPFTVPLWVISLSTNDGTLLAIPYTSLILIVAPLFAFPKPQPGVSNNNCSHFPVSGAL